MKDQTSKTRRERAAKSGLFTVKIVKTGSKTVSRDLVEANKRAKQRLADSRSDMHVMVM